MKFIIIEKCGCRTIEADDIYEAVSFAEDNHTHYENIYAVVRAEE